MIYLIFFVVIFLGFSSYYSAYQSGFNTFLLFAVFSFVYYMAIPLEMIFLNNFELFKEHGILYPPSPNVDVLNKILLMGNLSLLGFGLGFGLSNFNPLNGIESQSDSKKNRSFLGIALLTGVSILVLLVGFFPELISISNYQSNVSIKAGNSGFNFLIIIMVISASILNGVLISMRKIHFLLALGISFIVLLFGIYSSDKDPILLSLLPLGIYLTRIKLFKSLTIQIISISLVIIVLPIAMLSFSYFRSAKNFKLMTVLHQNGIYKSTDPRGGMFVLIKTVGDKNPEFRYGETYLTSLFLWLPKRIYPNRPENLAQEFAKKNMFKWKPGHGLGYSLLAESYINFGVKGAFLQYLILGLIWGVFWKFIRRFVIFDNPHLNLAIYSVVGYYLIIIMHRGPVSGIVTSIIQLLLPIVFFSLLFDGLNLKRKVIES